MLKDALAQYRGKQKGDQAEFHDPPVFGDAHKTKTRKQPDYAKISAAADEAHVFVSKALVGEAQRKIKYLSIKASKPAHMLFFDDWSVKLHRQIVVHIRNKSN